jgi:hypothetical protein
MDGLFCLQTMNHFIKRPYLRMRVLPGTNTAADDGHTTTTYRQRPVLMRCR